MTRPAIFLLLSHPLIVALILIGLVLMSGCTSLKPVVTEVEIPVAVPCLKPEQLPARPVLTSDADLMALGDYHLALRIARERNQLAAYAAAAGPLLEQCAR